MAHRHIMSRLRSFGVTQSAGIVKYVHKVAASSQWIEESVRSGALMDNNIILGALSEMDFASNTIFTPPFTSVSIVNSALKRAVREEDIEKHASRLKNLVTNRERVRLIIPVAHDLHWGVVIADARSRKVWRRDSLKCSNNNGKIYKVSCSIQSENYLLQVLNYETQKDGHSCGFYVVSAVCQFAESIGTIPAVGYRRYSSNTSEKIRKAAVVALFQRVEDLHSHCQQLELLATSPDAKKKVWRIHFNECGLSNFICQYRLRFFTDSVEDKSRAARMSKSDGLLSHGIVVDCIDKFVSDLKQSGEHFHKRYHRKNRMTDSRADSKKYNASRMYSCFKWRSHCKVTLIAYFYPGGKVWRVTKRGVHNHPEGGPSHSRSRK